MSSVLFVVAEMQEAKHLIEHYKMERDIVTSVNLWCSSTHQGIRMVVTGAGVNNVIQSLAAATYLRELTLMTDVINIGYAGAKGIETGSVVPVKACHCFEFPTMADTGVENCIQLSSEGYDCYTSLDFVVNADGVPGKALFDMEIAYIARFMCKSLYSIKIVSDNLDYDNFKSFDDKKAWEEAIRKIEERR